MRRRPHITNRAGTADRMRTARPRVRLRAGRTDWYAIRNATAPVAEVLIYDEIGYWGVSAESFVRELQGVTASAIDLRINSPGGEVFDGIAIRNAIASHPASVTGYVDGMALSAASFILQACDRRIMRRQSQLMIHDAMGLAVGNAAEMRQMADELDRLSDTIASIYAERGDGSLASWRTRMRAETWYGAQEAVEVGLADEVEAPPARPDNRMPDRTADWDLSIFAHPPTVRPEGAPQAHRDLVVVAPVTPAVPVGGGDDNGEDVAPRPAPAPIPVRIDMSGYDPQQLRDAIAAHTREAPAPPTPVDPGPELVPYVAPRRPAPPPPAPPPAPTFADVWDPELFRAALDLAASDAPAPTAPPPAEPAPDPYDGYDGTVVTRALREALR